MNSTAEDKKTGTKELGFLIRLLDDEDENVYSSIRQKLVSLGNHSSEFLKNYLNDENVLIKKRAKEIVSLINFESAEEKLRQLSLRRGEDILEEGAFLIASVAYPEADMSIYKNQLRKIAETVSGRLEALNKDFGLIRSLDIINTMNGVLFNEIGFSGNSENYYDPDNSFINRVLERKLGIPISLSVIYILVARKAGVPVSGVNLPGHFITKFSRNEEEYFIDPFNKGVVITMKEAEEFLKNLGLSGDDVEKIPYLKGAPDAEILLRMMRNLSDAYRRIDDNVIAGQFEKLMNCLA